MRILVQISLIILLSIKVSYSQNITERFLTRGIGYDVIDGFDSSYYISGTNGSALLVIKTNYIGDTIWTKEFGGSTCMAPADVNGVHLQKISDDKLLICGNRKVCGTISKAYFVEIDTTGNLLWENEYGFSETHISSFIQKDNYIYAVGNSYNGSNLDGVIIKLDSTGGLIWNNNFDFGLTEAFSDLKDYDSANLIIAGESNSFASTNYSDGLVCIVDTSGSLLNHFSFGGNQYESLNCINQLPDGYIFSGSSSSNSFGGKDAYLVKTDKQLNLIWEKNIGNQFENVSTKTFINNEVIFGTGWTYTNSMLSNAWLFEVDTLGNLISENNFGDSLYDFSFSLIKRENNLVMVGSSELAPSSNTVYLILLDSLLNNQDNFYSNSIESNIKVFPNPNASSSLYFSDFGFPFDKAEIKISDLDGRDVMKSELVFQSNELAEINIEELKSGLYFVLVTIWNRSYNFKLTRI